MDAGEPRTVHSRGDRAEDVRACGKGFAGAEDFGCGGRCVGSRPGDLRNQDRIAAQDRPDPAERDSQVGISVLIPVKVLFCGALNQRAVFVIIKMVNVRILCVERHNMRVRDEKSEKDFLRCYDKHADAIFRYLLYRVFDRELAKEMTQETFLRAWQYVAINPVEKMKSFLYRVATNLIVDYKRKKRERSLDVLAEAGFEPAVEEKDFGTDFIEIENVKKKIDRLEEPYREAILMRYIDELSPKEIAALTGESVNVVSVRITRAKEKLKKALLTE